MGTLDHFHSATVTINAVLATEAINWMEPDAKYRIVETIRNLGEQNVNHSNALGNKRQPQVERANAWRQMHQQDPKRVLWRMLGQLTNARMERYAQIMVTPRACAWQTSVKMSRPEANMAPLVQRLQLTVSVARKICLIT
jgi:hypothetical protein